MLQSLKRWTVNMDKLLAQSYNPFTNGKKSVVFSLASWFIMQNRVLSALGVSRKRSLGWLQTLYNHTIIWREWKLGSLLGSINQLLLHSRKVILRIFYALVKVVIVFFNWENKSLVKGLSQYYELCWKTFSSPHSVF